MLLVASYIFYGAWDWRFLSLLFISTILDYFCALKIHESNDVGKRKCFLSLSIIGNLGLLGFFKYFNFFAANLQLLLSRFGFHVSPHFLHIILPVGISFYTFQTMSYTIDVYRREMEPTKSFLNFSLFVSYFPQLVAGPIIRARDLLPQMLAPRKITLDKFYEGCYLIFWGLFQKVFIADNLAKIVDYVFASPPPYNGAMVILALYAFAFQIYCDFAGYSTIARGLGSCMGFDIMVNFNLPYFSTNPREFWQRWHISLSTWLRDYLYIPLGGNKKGNFMTYRNLAITMLLGGLWHGAAWTFVIWGAYHGLLLIIQRLLKPLLGKSLVIKNIFLGRLWFFVKIAFFFHLICLGWLIFRAQSLTQVWQMLLGLTSDFYITPDLHLGRVALKMVFFLWLLWIVELFQFRKNDSLIVLKSSVLIRTVFYYISFLLLLIFGVTGGKEFIYFQF